MDKDVMRAVGVIRYRASRFIEAAVLGEAAPEDVLTLSDEMAEAAQALRDTAGKMMLGRVGWAVQPWHEGDSMVDKDKLKQLAEAAKWAKDHGNDESAAKLSALEKMVEEGNRRQQEAQDKNK